MFAKIADKLKGIKSKAVMAGTALVVTAQSHAADLTQLDSLETTIGEVSTKANTIMTAIGSLALVIVVGVIVLKLIKKGSKAG